MDTWSEIVETTIGQWHIKEYVYDDWYDDMMQGFMTINEIKETQVPTSTLQEIAQALKNEAAMKEMEQTEATKALDRLIFARFGRLIPPAEAYQSEIVPTPECQRWYELSNAKLSLQDLLRRFEEVISDRS